MIGKTPLFRNFLTPENRAKIVENAKRSKIFHTSFISLGMTKKFKDFVSLLQELKEAKVQISFDTNIRPAVMKQIFEKNNPNITTEKAFEEIIPYVDILLAGAGDLYKIYGIKKQKEGSEIDNEHVEQFAQNIKPLLSNNAQLIIKRGLPGVSIIDENGNLKLIKQTHNIGKDEVVKDTTGGGDSWNGAYLFTGIYCPTMPIERRIDFANCVAGWVVAYERAIASDDFLKEKIKDFIPEIKQYLKPDA